MKTYDLLIIGGGSAGLTAADFAVKLGASVAILEKDKIGGDCTWTGCIPSKTLLKSAKVAHDMRQAQKFGLIPSSHPIEFSAVMKRVRSVIDDIFWEESPEVLASRGIDVYLGESIFSDPHTLSVGDKIVKGKKIIIATGARAAIPPIQGIANVEYHTYETIWDLDQLPERLLVLGAGMVGCELSQAFQRLGSQVTIIESSEGILPNIDRTAAQTLVKIFTEEGIQLYSPTIIERAWQEKDGIHLNSEDNEFVGDTLLIATGRYPNHNDLGFENAGIDFNDNGIQVDEYLRTSQKHIFAAGDVTGAHQFTHVAGWQGFMAARNALIPANAKTELRNLPWTLFTDPEIAQVGLTQAEAISHFEEKARSTDWPLSRIDRAHTEGSENGFVRAIYKANGKILGATIVSPHAGELINEWALAISNNLKIKDIANSLHVYPTFGLANMQLAAEIETERVLQGFWGKLVRMMMRV